MLFECDDYDDVRTIQHKKQKNKFARKEKQKMEARDFGRFKQETALTEKRCNGLSSQVERSKEAIRNNNLHK